MEGRAEFRSPFLVLDTWISAARVTDEKTFAFKDDFRLILVRPFLRAT